MLSSKKEGFNHIFMTKQEYMEKAIELAARCKLFAEKPCHELREETLICNCDEYGHALGAGYETFTIRREHNRVNAPYADRFGHVCPVE
jgi:hypothetical protein